VSCGVFVALEKIDMLRATYLVLGIWLGACGGARAGVPLVGPIQLTAQQHTGKLVFMRECNQCHPGGEGATGPALNDKSLPRPLVTVKVRQGALGSMPKFPEREISERELDALLNYLEVLRQHARG
jgi:mono/diheme cytochrome c family protein